MSKIENDLFESCESLSICMTIFLYLSQEYSYTYRGGFWNYFSMGELSLRCTLYLFLIDSCYFTKLSRKKRTILFCLAEQTKAERHFDSVTGMDAQVSYGFHSARKLHPEKFKNQLSNQVN